MTLPEIKPEKNVAGVSVPDWLRQQEKPLTVGVIKTALEQAAKPTVAQAERAIYSHLDTMSPKEITEGQSSIPPKIVKELETLAHEFNKIPDVLSQENSLKTEPSTETRTEQIARWKEKAKSVLS